MLIVGSHKVRYLDLCCFFIYVNDICDVSKELEFIVFADDTNVFLSHKNLNFLIHKVNFELS